LALEYNVELLRRVIKAQVHAGGRGKGGGVKLAKNLGDVESISENIIGMMLKTPQTTRR